jgi:hypothetical protein
MLVGSVDRAVEAMPFVVHVGSQGAKHSVPLAVPRPAIEAIEDRLPRTEFGGQIPPRRARPSPPKDGFDEISVICAWLAHRVVGFQERFDLQPLLVAQL